MLNTTTFLCTLYLCPLMLSVEGTVLPMSIPNLVTTHKLFLLTKSCEIYIQGQGVQFQTLLQYLVGAVHLDLPKNVNLFVSVQ